MKKMLFLSSAILALSVSVLLLQCSKKEPDSSSPAAPKVNRTTLPLIQGACNCGTLPPNCPALSCINKLLGGQNSKLFTITWGSCVDPDPSDTYCNGLSIGGTTSTLKLCYMPGSCDHIVAMISNPPSCLPCIPDPYCISLLVNCSDANHFTIAGNETFPSQSITVFIAADPKITVTCGPPGDSFNCSGTF
jgi:hypothetical protein